MIIARRRQRRHLSGLTEQARGGNLEAAVTANVLVIHHRATPIQVGCRDHAEVYILPKLALRAQGRAS